MVELAVYQVDALSPDQVYQCGHHPSVSSGLLHQVQFDYRNTHLCNLFSDRPAFAYAADKRIEA